MVIVSEDVKNVVNRIFLVGIAHRGRIPNLYGNIVNAFEKLDTSVANISASSVNSAPFAWKRDGMLILKIGSMMFSYTKTIQQNGETLVIIQEAAENGVIVTEKQDMITQIITETINNYLRKNLLLAS